MTTKKKITKKDPVRVAAGKKSKRKGSRGELKVAKMFSSWWGSEFARTPSSGGFATSKFRKDWNAGGDLVTPDDLFPFCVEVKNVKDWRLEDLLTSASSNLLKYWEQAVQESEENGKVPLLVFKRNRSDWFVMMQFEDWEYTYGLTALNNHYMIVNNTLSSVEAAAEAVVIMRWTDFSTEANADLIKKKRSVV